MPSRQTNISRREFAVFGNRRWQTQVGWSASSNNRSKTLARNMPRIPQGVLVKTTILLVALHCIETCYGLEPLEGFDEFAAKALDAFGTPGMSVAVVLDG